jgi:phospholipid/cholesterol/gamma-HCH transport system substrate-binding protein
MRINLKTIRRRSLGVVFLAGVVGLLYLSILFYTHAFTKTVDVTLYAGCQPDPQSGSGAPQSPSTGVTSVETASTSSAQEVSDAAAVDATMKSAAEAPPPSCTAATSQDQNAGHSLDVPADVKLRGIIVGSVSGISSIGNGAVIHIKLEPNKIKDIPQDVTAEIIPKTLFGEKYVSLVIPDDEKSDSPRIEAGDRILQSTTAIEAEQVFDDLLPLLQQLDPVDLSTTLTNLAEALQGRGNELGDTLARTDTYFSQLNPDLGNIQTDLTGLETLATNLHKATPDLLDDARQLSVNARTFTEKGDVFANFLIGTSGFAATASQILTTNEKNITALAVDNQPTLQILATYSPEYPCLLQGFVKDEALLSQAFTPRGTTGTDNIAGLHLNLTVSETTLNQPAYSASTTVSGSSTPFNAQYDTGILDDNRAYPNPGSQNIPVKSDPDGTSNGTVSAPCFGLPTLLKEPIDLQPPVNSHDPTYEPAKSTNPATAASESDVTSASASDASAIALSRVLAAPELGVPSSDVSDLTTLLVAPQLAGTNVSVTQ